MPAGVSVICRSQVLQIMKKYLFILTLAVTHLSFSQTGTWKIGGGKIKSPWADSINPVNVLPEYPRPQLKRNEWQNLNGLWQYAILPRSDADNLPANFQGNILVP